MGEVDVTLEGKHADTIRIYDFLELHCKAGSTTPARIEKRQLSFTVTV